jgi:sporulation protein YlmC with PRC-barrel domain
MQVALRASVRTRDGKDVGRIEKVIIDPTTGAVRSAVVRKGVILPDDIEIPLQMLQPGPGSEVQLTCTAEQVQHLPKFHEAEYTAPPPEYRGSDAYPPADLLWPIGYPGYPLATPPYDRRLPDEISAARQQQDLSNAVLDEGSTVKSRDGEKVGELHSVTFDTETGRPTGIIMRKGFLFTKDLSLPVEMIATVDDGVVYLNVSKEQVEQIAHTTD